MQAKLKQADIGQVYPKDNLLALEAEIFSLLAQEKPEKVGTFSELIQAITIRLVGPPAASRGFHPSRAKATIRGQLADHFRLGLSYPIHRLSAILLLQRSV